LPPPPPLLQADKVNIATAAIASNVKKRMFFRIRIPPLASSCDDRLGSVSEPVYNREQLLCRERGTSARRNAPRNQTAPLLIPDSLRGRDGLEPSAGNARSSDILFRKNDGKSSIRSSTTLVHKSTRYSKT
jgi:hypothetical protein